MEKGKPPTAGGDRGFEANSKNVHAPFSATASQSQPKKQYGLAAFEDDRAAQAWAESISKDAIEFIASRRLRRRGGGRS